MTTSDEDDKLPLTIRQARATDATRIAQLAEESHREYAKFLPNYINPQPADYWQERFLASLQLANYTIYVGEDSEKGIICGYVETLLKKTASPMILPTFRLIVDNIVVGQEARRSGIAKQLLAYVEEEARLSGVEMIELQVAAANLPALRLYRNIGFTERLVVLEKKL